VFFLITIIKKIRADRAYTRAVSLYPRLSRFWPYCMVLRFGKHENLRWRESAGTLRPIFFMESTNGYYGTCQRGVLGRSY